MVWFFKLLAGRGLLRPAYKLVKYDFAIRPGTFLGEDFRPFCDWFGVVDVVQPRALPSSSFSDSDLVGGSHVYVPTAIDYQSLFNSMRKLTLTPTVFSEQIGVELREIINHWYSPVLIGSTTRVDIDALVSAMDLTTSPGFPLYYVTQTKQQSWDRYKTVILQDVRRFLEGDYHTPLWTGTLKDEITHRDKQANHSTRMFFNGPFWFLIVSKIIFQDMMDRVMAQRGGRQPSTIGIQVPGPDIVTLLQDFQQSYDDFSCQGWTDVRNATTENGKFLAMLDTDRTGFDCSMTPTGATAAASVMLEYLPTSAEIVILGETISFNPQEVGYHVHCAVLHGYVSISGLVFPIWGNKSGQLLTAELNSMVEPVTMYPGLRLGGYLGSNPVNTWCASKFASNGDDGLNLHLLYKVITPQEYVDLGKRTGTFPTSVSGFTDNAFDMMYLSSKVAYVHFHSLQRSLFIARGREDKILSIFSYKKRRDPSLTLARFYAACNALFGYESRYRMLNLVDRWVSRHPLNKFPTQSWIAAKAQRLTDHQLAMLHTGFLF